MTPKCAAGYYGLYPTCSKCPTGPNGEPTTSMYGTATIIGCYIASGTDFEDNTGAANMLERVIFFVKLKNSFNNGANLYK